MNRKKEKTLIEVPLEAKLVREIQSLQAWIEPSIWSLRMLIALVMGVKGGKWYSLMDRPSTLAQCLLWRTWVVLLQPGRKLINPLDGEPPTGEPYAGEPHVRFGGRGDANQCVFPTPIGWSSPEREPARELAR